MNIFSRLRRFFFPRVTDNLEFKVIYVNCPVCGPYHTAVRSCLWPNMEAYRDTETSIELELLVDSRPFIKVDHDMLCPMCRSECETTVCLSLMARNGDDALVWFNQLVGIERLRFAKYDKEILKLEGNKLLVESRLAAWGLEDEVDNGDCADVFDGEDFEDPEDEDAI